MFTVLRRRNFALLWFGQLISRIGDWVLFLALPYYTYQLTGAILATGTMYLASTLPWVLLGSVAGVFVDRWSCKRTMIMMDISRAILLLLLLAVRSREWIWIVYLVDMLVSTTKRPCRTVEVHVLRVSSFVFASQSRREGMWSS